MAISEGIHGDIDLTKNKLFRKGAKDLLDLTDLNPGVTTWSPGFIMEAKKPKASIAEILKEYFPDSNWTTSYINKKLAIDYINNMTFEDSPIYNILSKMPEDSDIDDVVEMLININRVCNLEIKSNSIFIEIEPSYTYISDQEYNVFTKYALTDSMDNYTYHTHDYDRYPTETVLLDKYCPAIPNITLTDDEYCGNKMITGMSDIIYMKTRKCAILSKLVDRLANTEDWQKKHPSINLKNGESDDMYVCKKCGKSYKTLSKGIGSHSICPECRIDEYFTQPKGITNIDRLYTNGRFCFLRKRFHDFYSDILELPESYDLSQDQSYGYNYREDKTIEYFMHPVYEDNGLHLIHRKRNSHELVITLKDEEYDEDKDIPAVSFKPKKVLPCDDVGINDWLFRNI